MNLSPKRFSLLFLLMFCSFLTYGQSPGYMGKKTSVQFNFSSSPVWFGPTANNNGSDVFDTEDAGQYKFGFNTKYGFSLNRSIGRRVSIEASVDYGKTGYFNNDGGETFETISVFDGAGTGARDNHKLFFNARVTDFALALRMFNRKKGSLSPLGLYFGPRIGYSIAQSEILDRKTNYHENSDETKINSLGLTAQNQYYFVGFTTGYNRILKDAIVLNLSWDFSQYIGADLFPTQEFDDYGQTTLGYYNRKTKQGILRQRLSNINVFLFRVGVGYLF